MGESFDQITFQTSLRSRSG